MPASLRRTGSCFAPMWAAECLTCQHVLGRHRLISAAMREFDTHRQSWAHLSHGAPTEQVA